MLIVVLVLSVGAALFYAISDFLEQRAASRAAHPVGGPPAAVPITAETARSRRRQALHSALGVARRMVHDRIWFAGWVAGTGAYFVQAAALHYGSVGVVQALQVTTLLFSLPLSTFGRPERAGLREWSGGITVCAGLGLFLLVRGATPDDTDVHRGPLLLLLGLLVASVAVLVALAALRPGPVRATLLAVAAGGAFASSATLVKVTTSDLTMRGISATARDWPGYTLAVVTGLGVVLQQAAFASGRLPTATTAMVVTNPVVGTIVAVVAFGEVLPSAPLRVAGLALGALLVLAGVYVLAHSPLVNRPDDPLPEPAPAPERVAATSGH